MKHFLKYLLISASVTFAGQASAEGFLYDCTITDKKARVGWLSDTVVFVVADDGKIQVIDAVTLHFKVSPVPVRVTRNTDQRLVMHWRLKGIKDENDLVVPTFSYSARLNKETMKVKIEANPSGFSQRWVGRGSCVKRTK